MLSGATAWERPLDSRSHQMVDGTPAISRICCCIYWYGEKQAICVICQNVYAFYSIRRWDSTAIGRKTAGGDLHTLDTFLT